MAGDLYYFSLYVPDPARAGRFFGPLLNWELSPGGREGSLSIENLRLPGSILPGEPRLTFFLTAPDVPAALARARELDATTEEPQESRSGTFASVRDPFGLEFSLGHLSAEFEASLPEPRTGGAELGYFLLPTPDLAKATEFYAAVLGWEFEPGEQYAHITNTTPPGGLTARREALRPVPFFRVDDIAAAVAKVRELGGESEEPARSDSGLSCDAHDDQGTPFSLWQPAAGY